MSSLRAGLEPLQLSNAQSATVFMKCEDNADHLLLETSGAAHADVWIWGLGHLGPGVGMVASWLAPGLTAHYHCAMDPEPLSKVLKGSQTGRHTARARFLQPFTQGASSPGAC